MTAFRAETNTFLVIPMDAARRIFLISFVFSTLAFAVVDAQIVNGGFESGSFSPWTTTGVAAVQGTQFGTPPVEGIFQAVLTTPHTGTVSQSTMESFLGLNSGTLNSLNGTSTQHGGSAIQQTFTLQAGQSVSFFWDFVPNGTDGSSGQNDSAFFTLHLSSSSSSSITLLDQVSNHPTGSQSGYQLFTTGPMAAGTYLLGFGVYDINPSANGGAANAEDAALLIDRVVPEPATWTLLVIGSAVAMLFARRRLA